MNAPIQIPSPQLIHQTKETIRKVNAMGAVLGGGYQGRITIYHGLLTADLTPPSSWGEQSTVDIQIWEKNDTSLQARTPVTDTITIQSYDPQLSLDKGTYVIVANILGDFIILWASCWSDSTQIAT